MTGSGDNILPPLPPGLDEVDLLAWVEGDALPRNREVAVARLLGENPGLARLLEGMRRDRETLRAMPAEERAPADLLAGVQAALQPVMERQMLLSLQDGELVDEHLPVSLVVPPRRSIVAVLFRERAGQRMALAAGLLLLVGGATYMTAVMFSSRPQPSAPGPVAMVERGARDASIEDGTGPGIAAVEPGDSGDEATTTMAGATELEEPAVAAAPSDDEMGAAVALKVEDEAAAPALGVEDAIRLARQNRLVIRVQQGGSIARPEQVRERLQSARSNGWRYAGEAPQQVAAALVPPLPLWREPALVRPGHAFATSELRGEPLGAWYGPPAPGVNFEPPPPRSAVYMVQSRLDETALASLSTALKGVTVNLVFEEAPEEVAQREEPLPSTAPSAVLWWSQPPAAWTWWTSVPVVVEPAW
jgi:hypothetical protein